MIQLRLEMSKVWKISPKISNDLIEQLLTNRGIKTSQDKIVFFSPKLDFYEQDLDIPGIEKAWERIEKAIQKGELIAVFGDYDVDGICSCAILYKALTSMGAKVLPYIPHREREGYGLSNLGLEFIRDAGASVVITVDNGIVAFKQANFAKEIGLDLIITDHHVISKEKPQAYAIVHSVKMCGAAVAWCLVRNKISKNLLSDLLQFVAIATICDLIPLVGLGRAFVSEGLKVLKKTDNLGLLALINQIGIEKELIGSYEIGYVLGPRLNAIGRLEHAIDALRLLCTKDLLKANKLAKLLCDTNATRQQMTKDALEQARKLVDSKKKIHILASKDWSQGIIGLIAGRITEESIRPAIAISIGESVSKGSARSIDGVNIVEVIRTCSDILIDVGGHPGAAGFSIENKHIEVFRSRIEKLVVDLPDEVSEVLEIEARVESRELTKKLINQIADFEPFGFGNPKPVFATYNMRVSDIRTVGEGKHLKFKADDIDAIAFGMGELSGSLTTGQLIDLAYNLELNVYNGFEKIQLKVKDIKINSGNY